MLPPELLPGRPAVCSLPPVGCHRAGEIPFAGMPLFSAGREKHSLFLRAGALPAGERSILQKSPLTCGAGPERERGWACRSTEFAGAAIVILRRVSGPTTSAVQPVLGQMVSLRLGAGGSNAESCVAEK